MAHGCLRVLTCLVRTLAVPACKRLINKCSVEYRIYDTIDGVLDYYVPKRWRIDNPLFRLVNPECLVRIRGVIPRMDSLVKAFKVPSKVYLELKASMLLPFALAGVKVCRIKIVARECNFK